ncbi:hypothetical protein [Helicobacter pylori]|uniref:hypothetical protein n=1 Tax=Helicobacter pylori TaxID=210 RepID=UPI000EB45985|nr:hypothetical protein [Helicobacter pylori]RKV39507.1 hypothetical protein DEE33_04480 [Helicobacter pylori]
MKGISLVKIEFKGYALEFKKKMIQQDAMKIKKGSKNNKNPSQSKLLFIDLFLDCVSIEN